MGSVRRGGEALGRCVGAGGSRREVWSPEGNRWWSRGRDPSCVQRANSLELSVRQKALCATPAQDTPGTAQTGAGPHYPSLCLL